MNLMLIQYWLRRHLEEFEWLRNVPKKRFVLFGGGFFILVIVYYLFYAPLLQPRYQIVAINQCVNDHFLNKGVEPSSIYRENVSFVGNGLIGIDVLRNKQLIILPTDDLNYNLFTGFYPLVDINAPFAMSADFNFLSDHREGVSKAVQCSLMVGFCLISFRNQIFFNSFD